MRENASNMKPVVTLNAANRAGSATGAAVDRIGFDALSFLVMFGEWVSPTATGTHTIVAEESSDGSAWSAVAAAQLTKTLPVLDSAAKGNQSILIGYTGDARFVRIKSNVANGPSVGGVVGVVVLLGRARSKPAN